MSYSSVDEALVISNEKIANGIFKMKLQHNSLFKGAKAGQFVNLYLSDKAFLLPRPISICKLENDILTLVFRIMGKGTEIFSKLKSGDSLKISSPLGNSFNIDEINKNSSVILVGGGVGIPPMLNLAENLKSKNIDSIVILGFRDEIFLVDEFEKLGCKTFVCTDDGSQGFKGNVVEFMKTEKINSDYIFACGPKPMLKGVSEYANEHKIKCYLSLEERMGCGYGACVGCVVDTKAENGDLKRKRVCVEGPVFDSREIVF